METFKSTRNWFLFRHMWFRYICSAPCEGDAVAILRGGENFCHGDRLGTQGVGSTSEHHNSNSGPDRGSDSKFTLKGPKIKVGIEQHFLRGT